MLFRRGPYGTMFFKFVCIALDDLPKVQRLLSLSSSLSAHPTIRPCLEVKGRQAALLRLSKGHEPLQRGAQCHLLGPWEIKPARR